MRFRGSIMIAAIALLATSQPMHAQAGRADLRYRAPLPPSVVFVTIDSTRSTLNAPTGDMSTSSFLRSVSELRFAPSAEGVNVTAVLRAMEGSVSTPMGDMPMSVTDVAPVEMQIDESGVDPTYAASDVAPPVPGTSPGDMMGSARAVAGLLALPGRELELGETWSDTVRSSRPVGDLESDMVVVTHGAYTGDSILDGRLLNVLRISTDMTLRMHGTLRGMDMTQDMTTSTDERVLWDSSLHLPVSKDATGTFRSEMSFVAQGMTMVTTGSTRSITTVEPGG